MQAQQTSCSADGSGATYGNDEPALSVRGGKMFAIHRTFGAKGCLPHPQMGTH